MSAQEIISVFIGGGLIWRLPFFAAPGPSISLTSRNTARWNDRYPQRLEIENFGDKVAHNVVWEIREYGTTVLPTHESSRSKRIAPLKPGERFEIDVVDIFRCCGLTVRGQHGETIDRQHKIWPGHESGRSSA